MKKQISISTVTLLLCIMFLSIPAYAAEAGKSFTVAKLFNTNTDPDKAHWDLAMDYANKGFFKFSIIEFNKITPGSAQYVEAIQNAAGLAFRMQDMDNGKNHYTILVDRTPLLFTYSSFTSRPGALEDFMPGPNGAAMNIEMYSLSNTPITSIKFKVFCYDSMLEPLENNKGIYVTTISNLNIQPYTFYETSISLDPVGKVGSAKIALMEVTFADGTNWVSPLKEKEVAKPEKEKK